METIKTVVRKYIITFLCCGIVYALVEYAIFLNTVTPKLFWPLVIRVATAALIMGSLIGTFDIALINHFRIGIRKTINSLSDYNNRYGYLPRFRAGMHIGRVLVTWVGELKKEILYIGDVMNTTARIREDCKRLGQDLLISGEVAERIDQQDELEIEFLQQIVLRGKEIPVNLYSVKLKNS